MKCRIGNGFDVHRYCPGNGLWLGGCFIEADYSLKGHSDADVLLHALADALFGALGEPDIGFHFPDTDAKNAGRASSEFIEFALEKVRARKFAIANIDITLIGEKPKVSVHREGIVKSLAAMLSIDTGCVGLKATTTEGLGFTGRGEGLAAQAVVLLSWSGAVDSP